MIQALHSILKVSLAVRTTEDEVIRKYLTVLLLVCSLIIIIACMKQIVIVDSELGDMDEAHPGSVTVDTELE